MADPNLTVQRVAIDTLKPDPENVRLHSDRNLAAIKASLEAFGQQKPIVVRSDGVVIAGNGTLEAAKQLGWTTIDVVETQLEGSALRAFAIADNRTAELAEWDRAALASALAALAAEGGDTEAAGFTGDEMRVIAEHANLEWPAAAGGSPHGHVKPSETIAIRIYDLPLRAAIQARITEVLAAEYDVPRQCEVHQA